MTLNGRYALYCRKDASFGAYHKNLNEDIPILSAEKCRPMTLVSGGVRFMQIFEHIPWEGDVKLGLSTTAIFSVFAGYFWKL